MNSRSQTTLVGNDLDSLITSFTTAREALEGTHCQVLENAVDKLLKLALAAKRAKASTADSQPLTIVMWRFYQDLLRPICSAGKEAEIRFAPAMRHHIEILCSRICAAVEVTSLFKSKLFRRLPPKQDIATAAEQISGALDQFGNNESMTANIVKEGKMKFVLLQDKSTGPVPLDQEEEDPDPGNRQRVTNDILKQCPKFRILVLGKTGTGKSSLINRTFNVDIAKVSHFKAGEADINLEITSPDNDRFILHDSQGFEPGELKNLGIVKDFIRRRNMMPALQDKIHAVWLCIQVPFAQGRLLETGDEQFLKADFGLPVIVVFTKYDILSSTKEKEVLESPAFDTWSDDEVDAKVENACKYEYDKVCIEPLRRETGGRSLPSAKVSIFDDASLAELVKLTSQHARERVGEAVWLTWAVAQRASVDLNVDASIAIGKKNYWRGLASSFHFWGKSLKECMELIHDDVIEAWNFLDPKLLLHRVDVKEKLWGVVGDLADAAPANPNTALTMGGAGVTGIAGLVGGLSGPAAPIVVPIALGVAVGHWLYTVYQQTPGILRVLMGYIIDLTAILEGLFVLLRAQSIPDEGALPRPLTIGLINLTIEEYQESETKPQCHKLIKKFVGSRPNIFQVDYRDQVLQEVINLIENHRFVPSDECKQNAKALFERAGRPVSRNNEAV